MNEACRIIRRGFPCHRWNKVTAAIAEFDRGGADGHDRGAGRHRAPRGGREEGGDEADKAAAARDETENLLRGFPRRWAKLYKAQGGHRASLSVVITEPAASTSPRTRSSLRSSRV